jgi:glyoxylase-like metal-dependent hydrolase (beta-lactamase superfamily II)
VVDAPGHLSGHVNLLVRDEVAGWMLLAGDAAHSPDILSGKSGIATFMMPGTTTLGCAHVDKEAAELHIERMRALRDSGVDIVLHRDMQWFHANKEKFV